MKSLYFIFKNFFLLEHAFDYQSVLVNQNTVNEYGNQTVNKEGNKKNASIKVYIKMIPPTESFSGIRNGNEANRATRGGTPRTKKILHPLLALYMSG